MAERPISPHLQVWKWGGHMVASILHRITGDGMALVGLAVLLWWLGALAGGPESYETFADWMWTDIGALQWAYPDFIISLIKVILKIVLIGLSWAFFSHLSTGIRHFFMDIGAGYELTTNKTWSLGAPLIGILLTAAFWAVVLLK